MSWVSINSFVCWQITLTLLHVSWVGLVIGEWSERSYDLDSTKHEDRFHLDPAVVLMQITEQTGIKFTEEKQVVPVLFILQ